MEDEPHKGTQGSVRAEGEPLEANHHGFPPQDLCSPTDLDPTGSEVRTGCTLSSTYLPLPLMCSRFPRSQQ